MSTAQSARILSSMNGGHHDHPPWAYDGLGLGFGVSGLGWTYDLQALEVSGTLVSVCIKEQYSRVTIKPGRDSLYALQGFRV